MKEQGDGGLPIAQQLASEHPSRRSLLVGGPLGMIGTLGMAGATGEGLAGSPTLHAAAAGDPVGSWLVTLTPQTPTDPAPPRQVVFAYISGGILIVSARDTVQLPLGLDATDTGIGTWSMTGTNQFSFSLSKYLFTPAGVETGTLNVHGTGTLDATGATYTGTNILQLVAFTGTSLLGPFTRTAQAKRM